MSESYLRTEEAYTKMALASREAQARFLRFASVMEPFRRLVSLMVGQELERRYPSGRGPTNEQLNIALFRERP
jgi:hypothetical protein